MKSLILSITLSPLVINLSAAPLSIADLGLKPDSDQNATPIVRKALEQLKADGGGTLVFPKGIYHFQAEGSLITKDGPYVSNNQDDFPNGPPCRSSI